MCFVSNCQWNRKSCSLLCFCCSGIGWGLSQSARSQASLRGPPGNDTLYRGLWRAVTWGGPVLYSQHPCCPLIMKSLATHLYVVCYLESKVQESFALCMEFNTLIPKNLSTFLFKKQRQIFMYHRLYSLKTQEYPPIYIWVFKCIKMALFPNYIIGCNFVSNDQWHQTLISYKVP